MFLYTVVAAIAAAIAGVCLAAGTEKAAGVVYGKLDKAGRVTNILLIPVYFCLAVFCIALTVFARPAYDGFLGIIGWIVCFIVASAPLSCGLGLGFSASLRKKGKSKLSFAVQFAGFAGCLLSIFLFMMFYGNLLQTLN